MIAQALKISGMTCDHCGASVHAALFFFKQKTAYEI